jgi:hypothetical protein
MFSAAVHRNPLSPVNVRRVADRRSRRKPDRWEQLQECPLLADKPPANLTPAHRKRGAEDHPRATNGLQGSRPVQRIDSLTRVATDREVIFTTPRARTGYCVHCWRVRARLIAYATKPGHREVNPSATLARQVAILSLMASFGAWTKSCLVPRYRSVV